MNNRQDKLARVEMARFLVRVKGNENDQGRLLGLVRSVAALLGSQVKNPKWTSYGALEVDVFSPSVFDFDVLLAAVQPLGSVEFHRDLGKTSPHRNRQETFEEARRLFDAERYWECHEVLEEAWRNMQGDEKSFTQGVILLCAAFVHHQKGEETVALGVLARAIKQLWFPEGSLEGFDAEKLRGRSEGIVSDGRFVPFEI